MFIFALKSAIVLSLLYVPYLLMLRKESFFRFNRKVLCGILLASIVLPLCNLPGLSLDENPVIGAAKQQMVEVGIPITHADRRGGPMDDASQQTSWFTVVAVLYVLVVGVLLLLRLRDFIRLRRLVHSDCLWERQEHGVTIYCHRSDIPPFSWARTIVLSQSDYDCHGTCIIRHEMGHILNGHSWDILLLTVVQLVQWFNPLVWLMGQSLQDVHEYEADDYVLRGGTTLDEYRYLLIQKAVGASPYVFANNFNHSLLKKRIKMMCQKKSDPWQRAKALYAIPVAAFTLCFFASPEFIVASDTVARAATPSEGHASAAVVRLNDDSQADKPASFPGGEEGMMKWITTNIIYPKVAQEQGQEGRIVVTFIVEADGRLTHVMASDSTVAPSENTAARQALLDEAVRVVKSMPRWTPAKQGGKSISSECSLPMTFRLQ